jgi:hypothetical protein
MPLGLGCDVSTGTSVPPTHSGASSTTSTMILGYFSLSQR